MSLRSDKRNGLPPRSPFTRRENNLEELQLDKRRKIGRELARVGGPTGRAKLAFAATNSAPEAGDQASTDDASMLSFTREDVEALLAEKIKAKKFDFKARCDQMSELLKKFRNCVKWYTEQEEIHKVEQEQHLEAMRKIKENEEKLIASIDDARKNYTELEERLRREEAEKMVSMEAHKNEIASRVVCESRASALAEDVKNTRSEIARANQQIASLEDTIKGLQEYNHSLHKHNTELRDENSSVRETNKKLESVRTAITDTLTRTRTSFDSLKDQHAALKESLQEATNAKISAKEEVARLTTELQQVREDRDNKKELVHELTSEIERFKEYTGQSALELQTLIKKTGCLEKNYQSQKERIKVLEEELKASQEEKQMIDMNVGELKRECDGKRKSLKELHDLLQEKELRIFEGELMRRKLHNTILELKGNIRVFCRVRPLLPEDGCHAEMSISYPSSVELQGRGIELFQNAGQKYSFSFDKVFNHDATQEDVFVEISQLVQSALDGYKVCIFAYGQTGSGKTYTMMGGIDSPEQKGLIPRSLEQIFQSSQVLSSQGWVFKMEASMLEIYNETIRDLLPASRSCSSDASRADIAAQGSKYLIKHDHGNTFVSDLNVVEVSNLHQVSNLLQRAAQSRSVGRTQMNEQSSRSHCVFTLRISGTNESTEQQVQGVLNLIDLAGSERLSKSGSTGDRLKETQAINKSLSCLGDVILAISNRDSHVPFRNSKLTYLLQPCLGGDSKTLMFVNISPDSSSHNESLCSLRFAAKVNACEIGVPRRQTTHVRPPDSRLSYS